MIQRASGHSEYAVGRCRITVDARSWTDAKTAGDDAGAKAAIAHEGKEMAGTGQGGR